MVGIGFRAGHVGGGGREVLQSNLLSKPCTDVTCCPWQAQSQASLPQLPQAPLPGLPGLIPPCTLGRWHLLRDFPFEMFTGYTFQLLPEPRPRGDRAFQRGDLGASLSAPHTRTLWGSRTPQEATLLSDGKQPRWVRARLLAARRLGRGSPGLLLLRDGGCPSPTPLFRVSGEPQVLGC